MILVDSSAWVEYDRATGSPTDQALTDLIEDGGSEIAVTEPVLMEVPNPAEYNNPPLLSVLDPHCSSGSSRGME